MQKGDNEIKKELNVVKDHPDVSFFINKFLCNIRLLINEKYDHYIKVRDDLITELNKRIFNYAQQKEETTLNLIYRELSQNQNFSYKEEKIEKCINNRINEYKNELIKYKNENNMFLLNNEIIDIIIIDKTSYFKQKIYILLNQQKDNEYKLREKIEVKSQFIDLQKQLMKDKYNLRAKQLLDDLKSHLSSQEFYRSNFCCLLRINDEYQELLFNYIRSKGDEIMAIINQTLITRDAKNTNIIRRLNSKNEFIGRFEMTWNFCFIKS